MTTLTTKRVRDLYANATGWNFSEDKAPHMQELTRKNTEEFDEWFKNHDSTRSSERANDALKILTFIEEGLNEAGYNCTCSEGPDNVTVDYDWLEHNLKRPLSHRN